MVANYASFWFDHDVQMKYKYIRPYLYMDTLCIRFLFCSFFFNPLNAKFLRGNKNLLLHFVSFLHIDMTQVVEILPEVRQELTYST